MVRHLRQLLVAGAAPGNDLVEFDYESGRTDLVVVRYREPPLKARIASRISAAFPSDAVLQVFLGFDRRRAATPDAVAEETSSPPAEVRRAARWLYAHRYLSEAGSRGFRLAPAYQRHLTSVIAIEAKLSDWGRVIEQGRRAESFAHYSYVALDADRVGVTPERIESLRKLNIGLILVNESHATRVVLRPKRNRPFSGVLSMRVNEDHFHRWKGGKKRVGSTFPSARGRSSGLPRV